MVPRSFTAWRSVARRNAWTVAAGGVALAGGVAVFVIAVTVFPYHSSNHDEAVYLHQAAMLLSGQLELTPGELADAFRPWFFVQDGGRLYPRYAPVPAAMYAISIALFDEPRVTLAVIAGANVFLVYTLGSLVFDRRVGLVASVAFATAPLAVVTSSVFLPYAPTTFLQLLFAVAYLKGVRDGSLVAAGFAGLAIGVAFFARPFTAVLFASPFILHAAIGTARSVGIDFGRPWPDPLRRNALTAAVGAGFVAVTLGYNLRMTGSPFVFPFQAFAPLDRPGFGLRRLEGHALEYTPSLALEANGYVLWYFATRWFAAGPVGTVLAVVGAVIGITRWLPRDRRVTIDPVERAGGLCLLGVFGSVIVGNVLFWGNRNILGRMADPTDGMIAQFGPIYHFDLLVPLSLFAGVAVLSAWRQLTRQSEITGPTIPAGATRTIVVLGLVVLLLAGSLNAAAIGAPIERHDRATATYERVYAPIEETTFEHALVFVPTPYGDWLHHPFQPLRNEPDFDGPVVYALDRGPADDFRVIERYPDRTLYRFAYRGDWSPDPPRPIDSKLEPLTVHEGTAIAASTTVGVPPNVASAFVRIENDAGDHSSYTVASPSSSIEVPWSITSDGATLDDDDADTAVPVTDTDRVVVTITLIQPDGSTLTYRLEAAVRKATDRIEVVWPPERFVCTLVADCGTSGTYLPDDPDAHLEDVAFQTSIEAVENGA